MKQLRDGKSFRVRLKRPAPKIKTLTMATERTKARLLTRCRRHSLPRASAVIPMTYRAPMASARGLPTQLLSIPVATQQRRVMLSPRGVPSFLAMLDDEPVPSDQSGRRQLATWLTRPDHPLTARVMVNRIWQHHFGAGIVATPIELRHTRCHANPPRATRLVGGTVCNAWLEYQVFASTDTYLHNVSTCK